ncbi:alpha-(1-_3)-arabinofuranosyltransferase family protein [Ilumatobacter sp.]|uniref:alpha-(1->3)-arabinofuranosyltransferase domain-containing protein n=1 Tax=Ilumatobacter sp. TaxID=1967498 RepID=UPI003750344C|nr:DUF3367 domain-containing protein [Ilumatobacter sp.]
MARRPGVAPWRRISARPDAAVTALLAALALFPMLWTARGQVSADTKTYLTLDPGDLLASASSMWNPSVGAGTVPHQNIGYLFPLGPYYWLLETVGAPDWLAQRLLWAGLIFAASYGTYRLLRWLRWDVSASFIAAIAYGFSPYLLSYLARLSAILFPWAALPWMVLLAARAARERSWRPAAQFAIVVALVGSVNATSLAFAGLGPVLWLLTDAASGRVAARAVAAAAMRIGALSVAVSVWWMAGLRVQGIYGLPVLDFTETYQTVASASTSTEILRGLGYWFFYGGDFLDPWIGPAAAYFNNPAAMFLSFGLAGCALLGLLTPFRGRGSMLLLFGVGMVLSVGAAPLGDSTWYGTWFQHFATETTAGAALRSTPRAAPLALLALACGLGAGTMAMQRHLATGWSRPFKRLAPALPAAAAIAVLLNLLPWFTGNVTSASLLRPERLPSSTTELAEYVNDATSPTGRIYTIPGSDFANYRWGGTVDPVLPGLTDRSVLYRELIPQGSPATADLLNAFERRLFEGWFEPASLPTIAELLAVDTVVVRNDLEHERYRLARPGPLWTDVSSVLGTPDYAGRYIEDQSGSLLIDEIALARTDAATTFPINAAFDIAGGGDQLVLLDATAPLIVAGSGDGVVDLAAANLLEPSMALLYAATIDDASLAAAEAPWWVITDTNRKQSQRWSTLGFNLGAIESVGVLHTDDDPGDSRLELFDDELTDQTIAVHLGDVADVTATSYGSNIVYVGEDAPNFAADGDVTTAWRGAIAESTSGLRYDVTFVRPERLSHLMLTQPQVGATRFITRARVTTDDGSFEVDLTEASHSTPGQRVGLGDGLSTQRVSIEVLADSVGDIATFAGQPGVGFAEVTPVRTDGTPVLDDRVVRLPVAATQSIAPGDRLTYMFTRQRFDPATPNRQAPELVLDRQFDVPSTRSFELSGQARLAGTASDTTLAAVKTTAPADTETNITALASSRLPGSVTSTGAAAIDGDLSTAWQTTFEFAEGSALTVSNPAGLEFEELTIAWWDDGRYAVPTQITVSDGIGPESNVPVPIVAPIDGVAIATLLVPAQSGTSVTLTISGVSNASVVEYYSGVPRQLPIALAEVWFGQVSEPMPQPSRAPDIDTGCRNDLLVLDGEPLEVAVSGPPHGVLTVTGCNGPLELGTGDHRLTTAKGDLSGIDFDRIVLDDNHDRDLQPSGGTAPTPAVPVSSLSATAIDATLPDTTEMTWLVLPQSHNLGWTLDVDGRDLGEPTLMNGYANGWLIEPGAEGRRVELRWTPQDSVDAALRFSLAAGVGILLLLGLTSWRRREASAPEMTIEREPDETEADRIGRLTGLMVDLVLVAGFLVVGGPGAAASSCAIVITRHVHALERWSTRLAMVLACVSWGLVSGLIIAFEWRYDYADGPNWPLQFTRASPLTWVAVAAVVTSATLSVLAAHRRPQQAPHSPPETTLTSAAAV